MMQSSNSPDLNLTEQPHKPQDPKGLDANVQVPDTIVDPHRSSIHALIGQSCVSAVA